MRAKRKYYTYLLYKNKAKTLRDVGILLPPYTQSHTNLVFCEQSVLVYAGTSWYNIPYHWIDKKFA